MTEIQLDFFVAEVRPDRRDYGRAVMLTTGGSSLMIVRVNVPLEHGYIANAADIITAQLDKDTHPVPAPVLTPAGLKFVTDALEAPYLEALQSEDDFDEEPEPPKKKGKVKLETNLDEEENDEGMFADNSDEDNNDKPYQDSEEKWV